MLFISFLIIHARASFDGIYKLWRDMFDSPVGHNTKTLRLNVWMGWRTVKILRQTPESDGICTIGFAFDHSRRPQINRCWDEVALLLKSCRLRKYASEHYCQPCSDTHALGFGGKVGFTVPLCQHRGGGYSYKEVNVSIGYGCLQPKCRRSSCCATHVFQQDAANESKSVCPNGHELELCQDCGLDHECDGCGADLASGTYVYRCVRNCEFDLCEAYKDRALHTGARIEPLPLIEDRHLKIENPCGIIKQEDRSRPRRFGGLLAAILACGTIANIEPIAGFESRTHFWGMAGEARARRHIAYIVYDNACMLARYVRNKVQRVSSSVGQMLAFATYVLDRHHKKSHCALKSWPPALCA